MKTFKIEIIETLARTVKVKADSVDAAITKAQKLYRDEKIVLDENDYIDTTVELFDDNVLRYNKQRLVNDILAYFLENEKKNYEEYENKPKDHIYLTLAKLKESNKVAFPI